MSRLQRMRIKQKKQKKIWLFKKIVLPLHSLNNKVPWMSGLVNGLQNRLRRFESARHLQRKREQTTACSLFFCVCQYKFFPAHGPAGVLFGHPPALKGGFIRPPNAISITVPLLSVPCSACFLCRCQLRAGCGSAGNRK